MTDIIIKYWAHRSCSHDCATERQCCEWEAEVTAGCQTRGGQIQLATIWAAEDGVKYSWYRLPDSLRQEAFEALDEANCRRLCDAALEAVIP